MSDFHAARAELVTRGMAVSEVKYFGGGISSFYFKDPDGHGLVLWPVRSLDLSPDHTRFAPEAGQRESGGVTDYSPAWFVTVGIGKP